MLIHDYISDQVDDGTARDLGELHISKNKTGTNTIIENKERCFLIVDFDKLKVPVDKNNS